MSRYYLTEAYGDLYNPRKADETFYRNLKFVDYLQTEEIEEVMESLLWEFMDYGNTLDESYDLIEGVFSDDILEEVLCEAKVTFGGKASERVTTGIGGSAGIGKSRKVTVGRRGPSVGSVTFGSGKEPRTQSRIARLTGAAKKAKDTVVSAASGVGKNTMSTLKRGKEAAAGAYERAKSSAALKRFVRTGARIVGRTLRRVGEPIEKLGQKAVASGLKSRTAGRVTRGGQMELQFNPKLEPTTREKTGGLAQRIGGTIRSTGQRLFRYGARGQVGPHGPYQQNKTAPQGPKAPPAQGPRRPYPNQSPSRPYNITLGSTRQQNQKSPSSQASPRPYNITLGGSKTQTSSNNPNKPKFAPKFGKNTKGQRTMGKFKQTSQQTQQKPEPQQTQQKTAPQPTQQRPTPKTRKIGRLAPPTETQAANIARIKAEIAEREAAAKARKAAKNKPVSENYELLAQYILEDLINEGYADDFGSAMVILENLSDDVIEEIAIQYLEY